MTSVSVLGLLASVISLAGAAEPDVAPDRGAATTPADPVVVAVRAAPGVDVPAQLAADLRAAMQEALAGRTPPPAPVELTLDAGGVTVRVGSLARWIAVARWDDVAMRTIALHVLDLVQPAPEIVATAVPAVRVGSVADVAAVAPPAEPPPPRARWTLRAGASGTRGVEHDNPWVAAFAAGAAWARESWRLGAELGWEHAPRHQIDLLAPVSYDALPVRVSMAAQAGMLEGGVRAGVEAFRVTTDHDIWSFTPLAGAFVGIRLPATAWLHAIVVGGADVLTRRVQLTVGAATPYTTPRLAPYAGLMVEVGINP